MKSQIVRALTGAIASFAVCVAMVAGVSAEATSGWKGSTRVENKDKGYSIKFGGRIMYDMSFVSADDELKAGISDLTDGSEFRRARLFSSGTIYEVVEYKTQFDFEGGDATFKDVWVGVKGVPVLGRVRGGHQYEPIGLETQTSSKEITFIERSLTNSFLPERKSGILFNRELDNKRATVSAGVFRNSDSFGNAEGSDHNYTGRITVVAVQNEDNNTLVHLGAAGSLRRPDGDEYGVDSGPENHLLPDYVDTGDFQAEKVTLFGGEVAAIFGRASLQSEFVLSTAEADTSGDPSLSAFYVAGTVSLTGESRGYKGGVMKSLKPKRNYDGKGAPGAWELGVRLSRMDLNDGLVMGGELQDLTVALNWYLNPYTRIMFNFINADLDGVGKSNSFITRFQVSF